MMQFFLFLSTILIKKSLKEDNSHNQHRVVITKRRDFKLFSSKEYIFIWKLLLFKITHNINHVFIFFIKLIRLKIKINFTKSVNIYKKIKWLHSSIIHDWLNNVKMTVPSIYNLNTLILDFYTWIAIRKNKI